MKEFLKKGSTFVLVLIIVNLLLGQLFNYRLNKRTKLSIAEHSVEACMENASIVFFGDSHVQSGIDTNLIANSFNYSSGGESYLHTYFKIRDFVERYPDIEAIVIPFGLHSFSSFRTERDVRAMWYWRRYINPVEVWKEANDDRYMYSFVLSYFPHVEDPVVVGELFLDSRIKTKGELPLFCGFLSEDEVMTPQQLEVHAQDKIKTHLKGFELLDGNLVGYFVKILNLAQSQNIDVYLVSYPVSKAYRVEADKHTNIARFDEFRANIFGTYPHLKYIDSWAAFEDASGVFRNSDHLNNHGAARLSSGINSLLNMSPAESASEEGVQ